MKILTGLKTAASVVVLATLATASAQEANGVVRETLKNGLRVVIIRNALAPVATVEMKLHGGRE